MVIRRKAINPATDRCLTSLQGGVIEQTPTSTDSESLGAWKQLPSAPIQPDSLHQGNDFVGSDAKGDTWGPDITAQSLEPPSIDGTAKQQEIYGASFGEISQDGPLWEQNDLQASAAMQTAEEHQVGHIMLNRQRNEGDAHETTTPPKTSENNVSLSEDLLKASESTGVLFSQVRSPDKVVQRPSGEIGTEDRATTSTSSATQSLRREAAPASSRPGALSASNAIEQTNETYQIKHVSWIDASSSGQLRQSPILIQNSNGPCPLLALINALSLSNPLSNTSGLVETLCVRQQVSLGLLLDAVFDELMHRRGGDAAEGLPDVGDLYAFLMTLHTGMNVNPRFVPPPKAPLNLMDAPLNPVDEPTAAQDVEVPGSFEETQGMRLYGTFSIPLVHGWLPREDHPAYSALQRSARTYEDAQNLLFREEELEDKLRTEGLSRDEQQLLQDVVIVKYFLTQSATQLTKHGLEVLERAAPPGSLFILFRNDHFSTVYKHPRSQQLLQLVTDMGYVGHEEIVWESLVDVTGEKSEFLAGDFRPVGGTVDGQPRSQSNRPSQEPNTDNGRRQMQASSQIDNRPGSSTNNSGLHNPSALLADPFVTDAVQSANPNAEQEDHDLALALQLQEEEEDQHERDLAARRHEERLSREVLSHQATPPSPRRRRSGRRNSGRGGGGQEIRPLVPVQTSTQPPIPILNGPPADAPPPTYEQAASGIPYHPPPNHPAHPASPTLSTGPGPLNPYPPPQQQPRPMPVGSGRRPGLSGTPSSVGGYRGRYSYAAAAATQGHHHPISPGRAGGRQNMGVGPVTAGPEAGGGEGKRECVVM